MPNIERLWADLAAQTAFRAVEAVVLDSGSTDGTLEAIMAQNASVYSIGPEQFSFGRSCNWMMELTRAPIVVFLSGHVRLCGSDLMEQIATMFSSLPEAAGYLRQVPNEAVGATAYDRAYLARRFPSRSEGRAMLPCRRPGAFSNAGSVVCRQAWRLQPFPDLAGSEDHAWAVGQLRAGRPLYYIPNLRIEHSHGDSPEQITRRVRLNAGARHGVRRRLIVRAVLYGVAVGAATLVHGAGPAEAWGYGRAHARGYWRT